MSLGALARFLVGAAYTVGAAGAVVALSLVQPRGRAWERVGRRWARGLLRICGLELDVVGAEHLAGPAVFVANHQSFLDPMVLTALLPASTKWVAKAEFRRVPLLGRAFGACAIYVDRLDPPAAREALAEALAELPAGWSVAVFPEGTRSGDGRLLPFKKGAVHVARRLGLPIVPVGVAAAPATLPYGPRLIRPGRVRIVASAPLATGDWSEEEADQRAAELEQAVRGCLAGAGGPAAATAAVTGSAGEDAAHPQPVPQGDQD